MKKCEECGKVVEKRKKVRVPVGGCFSMQMLVCSDCDNCGSFAFSEEYNKECRECKIGNYILREGKIIIQQV